jgi:hypothetical protein
MNDYAHLQLHEAAVRRTARNAEHPVRRHRVAVLSRRRNADNSTRRSVAGRASQVRPA